MSFAVTASLEYGSSLVVVGEAAELGAWDPESGFPLSWSDGDVWVGTAALTSAGSSAFKFVVVSPRGERFTWEEGDNHTLDARTSVAVTGAFGGAVSVEAAAAVDSKAEAASESGSESGSASGATSEATSEATSASPSPASPSETTPASSPTTATPNNNNQTPAPPPPPLSTSWIGASPVFVQHRDKDLELRNTAAAKAQTDGGVSCPEGSASRAVAAGAASAPSWLARLELVQSLIGQNKGISADKLAASAAFLSWISTGTIACAEDGDHHRPNRAAEVSRDVFVNLETVAGTLYTKHGKRVGEVEKQLMRQVHPWLPSFSGEFTCSVPMTRIRDIAHRGDIPQELKKEIKHTLQNKIHRNAGPEDLVAVQAMWERIEHADYSEDFKYQFRLFNEEMRRFFNAAGATERLDALGESLEDDHRAAADEFRDAIRALDDGSAGHDGMVGGEGEAVLRALRASATCRAHFTRALSTGMRNDAPDDAVAHRQAFRLAEIALEESAFVIMARALACAGAGVDGETDASRLSHFAAVLSSGDRVMWTRACEAASESLRHLSLSGWRSAECDAAAREMSASGAAFDASEPETALRVVAALQRARRVVEAHTAAILEGFGDAPANLGRSFGLPPHVGEQYAESVVRAGVPFQLSRLIAPMLRAASDIAGCNRGGFDPIVMGVAVGRLVECDAVAPGALGRPEDGPVVALARTADGDEEVSAAGAHVRGVVLARDLPHLSHLAIRARQERVPMAATEDADTLDAARALAGTTVALSVTPEGVTLAPATEAQIARMADEAADGGTRAMSEEDDDAAKATDAVEAIEATVSDKAKKSKKGKGKKKGKKASVAETSSSSSSSSVAASGAQTSGAQTSSSPAGSVDLASKPECHPLTEATASRAGAKAAVCGDLAVVAARSDSLFRAPPGVFVPFGAMEAVVRDAGLGDALAAAVDAMETAAAEGDANAVEAACEEARSIVLGVPFPPELAAQIAAAFGDETPRVVVRSSANVEDLAGMSAAGLYESVLGVSTSSAAELGNAAREVWASLYTRRAVLARHAAGVRQDEAKMAVMIQEMAPSELSFVLHTRATSRIHAAAAADAADVSPVLEAEIAVGLGETLASGARGTPWRLEVDQATGTVRTVAFASVGEALRLMKHAPHLGVTAEAVDYSKQPLTVDASARAALGLRLAAIGAALEAEYGAPQDVEGAVVGDDVFVVQSRPQPLD